MPSVTIRFHLIRFFSLFSIFSLLISSLSLPLPALADHTPDPASVNLVGNLESAATAGACGDWDPGCTVSAFAAQGNSVYLFQSASIPAGAWEYKVAMGSWAENYGANFQQDGPNIQLVLSKERTVRFFYDHKTHYIADNVRNTIYTVPGSFNSELGCGDWQPECLCTLMSDVDGDGIFSFVTEDIPFGNYEFKIATNESWSNPNYGVGGGFDNVPFTVPGSGFRVTITFNTANNTPAVSVISTGPQINNDVMWDGLRHDSRDPLYRTPGGAVEAGTPVTLRFRTFHNDVTAVKVRLYSVNNSAQQILPMSLAAADVDCYQPGLPYTCDFWQATLPNAAPENLWYRFIVSDGSDTDYYADNTPALDGGMGGVTEDAVDQSYALMVYDPAFLVPNWAKNAVIYQIFPDRFRDGRKDNNPKTGDIRYDDPALRLPWGTLPEGYCRNYADGATNCPWRFDPTPPDWSPTKEGPRGRDYMGGDLKGIDQSLIYLQMLGVNTLYFNPVFDSGSNHGYDTQDYYKIDPYFGTQKDWENLVKHANQLGMRIVLDGVFNHLSSDSPFFDRYGHYAALGACESASSPYRSWFYFRDVTAGTGTCVSSAGVPNAATYDGWFGFDSIPVINKSLPEVQAYFLTGPNNVTSYWLKRGASAWRMDVMGDASFPAGYWETFRAEVKDTKSSALIISETWQKDSTLLRMLRGDRADTTMNYRLRDAVIGLLAPGAFDSKGFADSGRVISPTEFANRLASIQEDYPEGAFYSLMNLLDSHDTERLLWTLTPGAETRADKEFNLTNLAEGKQRQRLASLIQYTLPGAPTVFYGDEVALTGDDDPDDRRTYPWYTLGGKPDSAMFTHYQTLASLRKLNPVLTTGDFKMLFADDVSGTVAFGRKTTGQAAVILVNRSKTAASGAIPVAGYLPDGLVLRAAYVVGSGFVSPVIVVNGVLQGTIGPLSAVILLSGRTDLLPPAAPAGLVITNEGNAQVSLTWSAVMGAAGYNVYRSPLSGGGFVKLNSVPLADTSFTDTAGLKNGQVYFYVVTALDTVGNESAFSNEASALPHQVIGWANTQWPPSMTHPISVVNRTDTVYGQVWIDGATNLPGQEPTLRAQLGFGPDGSDPSDNPAWSWVDASFNVNASNNDEFKASLLPEQVGTYNYAYRYSTTNGRDWVYADLNGTGDGYSPANAGSLTVVPSGDTTPPAVPAGLRVESASPGGITLAWDAVTGDATLYGYEVLRSDSAGGPYTVIALLTGTSYTDTAVVEQATYSYVVRAVDNSFNRSGYSNEVQATAVLRTVSVVFTVTVPATTPAGSSIYIAGTLNRLDGGLPEWNASGVALTQVNASTWTITLTGKETTQIEYKYTLGSWDNVEKGTSCDEVSNRLLTLSYGTTGTQTVNDTVLNWRNIAPCGN